MCFHVLFDALAPVRSYINAKGTEPARWSVLPGNERQTITKRFQSQVIADRDTGRSKGYCCQAMLCAGKLLPIRSLPQAQRFDVFRRAVSQPTV